MTEEIKKPSLYIAMPCYDSVKVQTMTSMCKLIADLTKAGIKIDMNTLKSPYISYARNILTARFMQTDKDYLLFIDSDVEFEPECALRMVVANKDIVCTPSGMMLIHRRVFETLQKNRPDLEIDAHQHQDLFPEGLKIFSFWDCTFNKGKWTGDDIAFCNLATANGFKLYANIESTMIHHGSYGYKGRYGDGLISKGKKEK